MFSRVAIRAANPSALGRLTNARFISNKVVAGVAGSKGRIMPKQSPRATAPADNAEATLTIKVCATTLGNIKPPCPPRRQ